MSVSRFPGVLLDKTFHPTSCLSEMCTEEAAPGGGTPTLGFGAWAPLLVCQHSLGSSSSQVPLPLSEGTFGIGAARLEPPSFSPRGSMNLLKDWLLGHYCSIQVILRGCTSASSEAGTALFACTTARLVNYFIFSFCKQAFLVTLASVRFEIGELFILQTSPFGV